MFSYPIVNFRFDRLVANALNISSSSTASHQFAQLFDIVRHLCPAKNKLILLLHVLTDHSFGRGWEVIERLEKIGASLHSQWIEGEHCITTTEIARQQSREGENLPPTHGNSSEYSIEKTAPPETDQLKVSILYPKIVGRICHR